MAGRTASLLATAAALLWTAPLCQGFLPRHIATAPLAVTHTATPTPRTPLSATSEEASALDGGLSITQETTFPLTKVVGNEAIKSALLLATINPRMGGVVISGGRGTAKSVMAKGLHRIMPPIEVVKGSPYNIDPAGFGGVDSFLEAQLDADGTALADLETEIVPCPFVQIPLNVLEDRLLGSVNVEQSVKTGKTVFEPGLLARAHRGVLYVDDINLLDSELANVLLTVMSEGVVKVEREGMSVRYPCRPLLVATFNPEEAELRDHLMDRIAVALSADAQPLDMTQRIDVVDQVVGYQRRDEDPEMMTQLIEEEDQLRTRIIFARENLADVTMSYDQKLYLAEEAGRAGCQGHRAEIFACEIARASAALEDKNAVDADDLRLAVKLAILPRGNYVLDELPDDMEMPPPPPPPPPPQQDMEDQDQDEDEEEQPDQEEEDQEDQEEDDQEETEQPQVPQEFMFDAEGTPVDPDLLQFAKNQNRGKGGGRGLIFSNDRGRYIKAMLPKGGVMRLAVDATMRAAAPYQRNRRARANGGVADPDDQRVFIQQSDVRSKRMARKAGSLIIFVCDASGSMALNRMNAAKGAALSLLTEAYQSRDKIAIIPFQGDAASVLLPPTRSITMARSRLETMPCGGGSPLAHALNLAVRTGMNEQKAGDVGKVVVVCISDGRANVPLSYATDIIDPEEREKPDKQELKDEVISSAKQLMSVPGFSLVMLDTENKFVSTGMAKEIAKQCGGRYHYIPKASDSAIAGVANQALTEIKAQK